MKLRQVTKFLTVVRCARHIRFDRLCWPAHCVAAIPLIDLKTHCLHLLDAEEEFPVVAVSPLPYA